MICFHEKAPKGAASHLVLFSVFFVHSKRTPGLYGLNDFKLEFPIQAQRQRNLTCHKRSRPPTEYRLKHVESSMLNDKFHYRTILGCDVTDFKYVTEYGRGDHFVMCLDHLCKAAHHFPNS